MGDIAVGEDHPIHIVLGDQVLQLLFLIDGNALGIARPGQLRRITAVFDVGDLRGGEGNDFVSLIAPEEDVEVMEITPGSAHDDDPCFRH